ncbi:MAG: rhodanese-like domain-containing protein, partial [Nannocystaceae bacterium]|nr:rhodanese-like domain-containing protein [Nannocystaceae bacterium]
PKALAVLSPGGTPEVSVDALAASGCNLRIVDVRTRAEVAETGVIPGSEHVPVERIARGASRWEADASIVLVCRSGRRSGAAAEELAQLGFTQVASLTGGLLAWEQSGRGLIPLIRVGNTASRRPVVRELSAADIQVHVSDRDRVRRTKAATLLLHGTQACLDGRDAHAIVGTPGGDAGELVLALATAEALGGVRFSAEDVERVFASYIEAFGHFYLHTDVHAAQRWLASAGVVVEDGADLSDLLRSPPRARREHLLATVSESEHVGCGHLRLSLQHPEAYGVRPALVRAVLVAYFRRLWSPDARLEFVVLEGGHAESAVVEVDMGGPVHAYSSIPLVSPRVGETEVFVVHPQVSAFIRRENAAFLLEAVPSLMAAGVDEPAFLAAQRALAQQQLNETTHRLAPDLPVFVAEVRGDEFEVYPQRQDTHD